MGPAGRPSLYRAARPSAGGAHGTDPPHRRAGCSGDGADVPRTLQRPFDKPGHIRLRRLLLPRNQAYQGPFGYQPRVPSRPHAAGRNRPPPLPVPCVYPAVHIHAATALLRNRRRVFVAVLLPTETRQAVEDTRPFRGAAAAHRIDRRPSVWHTCISAALHCRYREARSANQESV